MAMQAFELEGGERRLGPAMSEINVTPFVDVVLVLLIIFLLTAPMLLGGIDVRVPKAETRTAQPEERITITITQSKGVYLENSPTTLQRLEAFLRTVRQKNPRAAVFVKADEGAPWGTAVAVMDRVKRAGIERVGIVTDPVPPGTIK
ncbi:MAG TPA: biopolymer transporter ExbD [Candidatus Sulfotelmatobacter sp.]|nr:biopolymer transporter ExbD [Candidatus Sulfotelmatobacter sp.]